MADRKYHEICFRDIPNDWDNALPVGNGKLGAMVFLQDHVLHIALNHYDCYYQALHQGAGQTFQDPARTAETYWELCRRADAAREAGNTAYSHYARTLHPGGRAGRPSYRGACYPPGGEALFQISKAVDMGRSCLKLRIEEAAVTLEAGSGEARVAARIWADRDRDGIVVSLSQAYGGLWEGVRLTEPPVVGMPPGRAEYAGTGQGMRMRTAYARKEDGEGDISQELVLHVLRESCSAPAISETITAGAVCYEGTGVLYCEGGNGGNFVQGNGAGIFTGAEEDSAEGGSTEKTAAQEDGSEGVAGGRGEEGFLPLTGADALITAVLSLQPGFGKAGREAEELAGEIEQAKRRHQAYWERFWVSEIHLPDGFLERLWYLQLYLMECSCGRGSAWPEQACGLSGLWDIRRPNMWGSMWYWDVNIQSAFWGWGCAGHPEFLKLFCDGYLAYEPEIRTYTKKVYGVEGWALDYPHTLYNCIQPWCAQFLWQYWQYSRDLGFLKEKAYPVFLEQIAFFRWLSEPDGQGIRHIRYDISPEQGPVTEDSVISISCIRRLLRIADEAGQVLGRPEEELEAFRTLEKELPPYPLTADGSRHKDSLLVQDSVFLRHPSLLMPLFPAEEKGVEQDRRLWEATFQYAAGHTETGTFGVGWLAAAAARLGRGRTAVRLLYEKGLDYILHNNGLAYEESERFLNYCHLTKPSHFLPVMMEAAGGLVNAVNQMLLQTGEEGEIRIFLAIPDDTPDILERTLQYDEDVRELEKAYGSWQDVSFSGLLAPGGFRVSARRRGGRTVFLKVESRFEATLKLLLPEGLTEGQAVRYCAAEGKTGQENERCSRAVGREEPEDGKSSRVEEPENPEGGQCRLVEFQMKPGDVLCWGRSFVSSEPDSVSCQEEMPGTSKEVLCHVAAGTRRRIFLGGDRHTAYYRAIDAFTCPYLLANEHRYPRTPYVFDFGSGMVEKEYADAYPVQIAVSGQCALYAAGPESMGACAYSQERGYGFLEPEGICAADRGAPDALRRDFLEGRKEAIFALYLPKGKYDILLVSGDEQEPSLTRAVLCGQGTEECTGELAAGRFGCLVLPVVHRKDGMLRIGICTEEGYRWKLNAMFVNQEYGLPG